jgi:plasmid maintenance system antidote protein VapI
MPKTTQELKPQNPNLFLDKLLEILALKNDAALARLLEIGPPVISKLRHERVRVTASMLIKAHDATGLSIGQLREVLYTPVEVEDVIK